MVSTQVQTTISSSITRSRPVPISSTASKRPPMLGTDLDFRICSSPESAKFETDQQYDLVPPRACDGGGLWGGYCVAQEEEQYLLPANRGPPMIATPRRETAEYGFPTPPNGLHHLHILSTSTTSTAGGGTGASNGNNGMWGASGSGNASAQSNGTHNNTWVNGYANGLRTPTENGTRLTGGQKTPRAKPSSGGIHMLTGLSERLSLAADRSRFEEELEAEFNDDFVTQVYNYLSLGYPAMARQYDAELSRISQIPEEELRKDDFKVEAKGHIGLAEAPTRDLKRKCARWEGLKAYIREWARQHPFLSDGASNPSGWGPRERRGSWAA